MGMYAIPIIFINSAFSTCSSKKSLSMISVVKYRNKKTISGINAPIELDILNNNRYENGVSDRFKSPICKVFVYSVIP